jgi:hypothetical protein
MAKTIEQIQTLITSKVDAREIINEIADYLQNSSSGGSAPYLVYTALLSQTGTDAPVEEKVFINTIGAIVWTREALGNYRGTLAGAFGANAVCPTFADPDNNAVYGVLNYSTSGYYQIVAGGVYEDYIQIFTQAQNDLSLKEWSDVGGRLFVEIRVYP